MRRKKNTHTQITYYITNSVLKIVTNVICCYIPGVYGKVACPEGEEGKK